MKLSDCVKMAFSDLNRRKLRTALTAFGIAVGTTLVITMAGLGEGIQKTEADQIKQMDTFKMINVKPQTDAKLINDKNRKIEENSLSSFKNISGVSSVKASIDTTASEVKLEDKTVQKVNIQGNNLNYKIFTEAEINQTKADKKKVKKYGYKPVIAGNIISNEDKTSVLVGQGLLSKLGIKDYKSAVGKEIEIEVSMPKLQGIVAKPPLTIRAKIAGVVNRAYNVGGSTIISSDETAAKIQEYYMDGTNYISQKGYDDVMVECKNMENVKTVDKKLKGMGYVTQSYGGYADSINTMLIIFKVLLIAAGVIVLLVASIGVINTMSMAVHEKTKSIGIMKAEGASKKNIRTMFVVQSGSLGFVGAALGTVISIAAEVIINKVLIMNHIGGMETGMKIIDIGAATVIFTIIFTVCVAMIAGIVPARKAAKLDPIESLRFE